ncbi:MAG: hypothetical protein PHV82_06070 [Victivallaceae bacterium]|nr:hypothetical protein [Victivallaceae bacterium]
MKFAPKPENDFAQFIRTYYDECQARFGRIEAIAGKWMFRDLIPGMSDFDTRFIVSDNMAPDDWCEMSMAIGRAHHYLCQRFPEWARNLEHLPGINLTWNEFTSEENYYPEYRQWSFYHTREPGRLSAALEKLDERNWSEKDEYHFLKKFCLYYGRYNRSIDPPVNLGPHANKYPLHSRIMHYFEPPVQAAVILLRKEIMTGKFESLESAGKLFPEFKCWELIREILHANYEIPKWYGEPYLTELEDAMEYALQEILKELGNSVSLIPRTDGADIGLWRKALERTEIDPGLKIFENAKFSRLMKGRLWFYANAPGHFDSTWLIENELLRMNKSYIKAPFPTYWKEKTGEDTEDVNRIFGELAGNVLTEKEVASLKEFNKLTPGYWEKGKEKNTALKIVEIFDDVFRSLVKISTDLSKEKKVANNECQSVETV